MSPDTDPAALVAGMRERNEHYITAMAFTEWTVSQAPSGDLRRALAALEKVLEAASRWQENSTGYDARALCAGEVRRIIGEELSSGAPSPSRPSLADLARQAAADWQGTRGDGDAAEAFRSAGRQLADLIRQARGEGRDG